jgi:hypothetical protein
MGTMKKNGIAGGVIVSQMVLDTTALILNERKRLITSTELPNLADESMLRRVSKDGRK